MSETTTEPTPAATTEVTSTETTEVPTEAAETEGNAEAARYRVRAREAEGQRDQLAERVQRMQRAEVERHAAGQLAVAADLFAVGGIQLEDLLDEDGNVDPGLVDTAVFGLLADRPGLRRTAGQQKGPTVTGHQPVTGGGSGSWTDVLQNPGKH